MDGQNEAGSTEAQSLTDIQSYLANFNKEISDNSGQGIILQQGEGQTELNNIEFYQGEEGSKQEELGLDNEAPATGLTTLGEDGTILIQPNATAEGDTSETAVQVLASMAATSIPEVSDGPQDAQLVAVQNDQDSSQPQLVALQNSTTSPVAMQAGQSLQVVPNQTGDQNSSVVLNTGNSYQTVTIVPSEVNQGGEVSYVLIVSQPEGEQKQGDKGNLSLDMSVYDFKEDKANNRNDMQELDDRLSEPQRMLVEIEHDPSSIDDCELVTYLASLSYEKPRKVPMPLVEVVHPFEPNFREIDKELPTAESQEPRCARLQRRKQTAKKDYNTDLSKSKTGATEEFEEQADDEGNVKKVIKVTPKKTASGMQAQLMCNYCNYTSPKRYLLTRHMKTHSEERPHKCNICDRGFKTVASLQNHINTHTGVRPHKCKECEAMFTTSGELVRHVRYRHTFEKPHHCTECDYSSVELSKLKRHMRSHTGERPYSCPHCSYASPDTYKLKRHLRIHTGEKPYECDVCHARFTQSNSLKAHKLIHTGNKPIFQCELCPTTCGRKTDLKIHVQKLHTSEKPLQCKKCGKSFPDRYTYKIHLKTHEGEKCFKCELCPYAALSQRHLESHILTHTGEKPYQCDECDQAFRQKQLLKRHKNLYHTPDYVAPHPREKTHECGDCRKTFAHRGNLLRHMALHDPENAESKAMLEEANHLDAMEEASQNLADLSGVMDEEGQEVTYVQVGGQLIQVQDLQQLQQLQNVQIVQADTPQGRPSRGRKQQQQVAVQLVTEDGQNATQIFLQMEEGAEEEEQQEAVEEEEEDEEEEEAGDEEAEPEVESPEPEPAPTPVKRGRGRPPKSAPAAQVESPEPKTPEKTTSPRGGRRGVVKQEPAETPSRRRGRSRSVAQEEEPEQQEEEEVQAEEQEVESPRKGRRGRKRAQPDEEEEERKPKIGTPKRKKRGDAAAATAATVETDERRREEQKKKDIEECFGFDVDEEA